MLHGLDVATLLALDIVGSALLLCAGLAGASVWWQAGRQRDGTLYWLVAGAGLVYLAADERLSLHEPLGRWVERQGLEAPLVNHTDDAILIACGMAGLAVSGLFWRELARHPRTATLLGTGAVLTAGALVIDSFLPIHGVWPRLEESLEFAGICAFTAAVARRAGLWLPGVERTPGRRRPLMRTALVDRERAPGHRR